MSHSDISPYQQQREKSKMSSKMFFNNITCPSCTVTLCGTALPTRISVENNSWSALEENINEHLQQFFLSFYKLFSILSLSKELETVFRLSFKIFEGTGPQKQITTGNFLGIFSSFSAHFWIPQPPPDNEIIKFA